MAQFKKFFSDQLSIVLASVLLFLCMYALNHFFPITLDDWTYSLIDGRRVTFSDILPYQYAHYFGWGGRSVVHSIAQIMLASGVFWGDLINSIGYLFLVVTIYYICNKGNTKNASLFIGINLLIWFLTPSLIENIFWITGSANYMWGTLLILLLISFYSSVYLTNKSSDGWGKRVSLLFLGILAGWTNENMAVAMIFFVVVLMFLMKYEKQKLPKWMIWGLIGAVIGCAVMLLAPGNYVRNAGELTNMGAGKSEPIYMFYFYRFTNILKLTAWYALIPTVIYAFFVILYFKFKKVNVSRKVLFLSLLFAFMAGVATLAMVAAPIFPTRVWFAILILLFIATGLLYANLDFKIPYIKYPLFGAVCIAAMVFIYSYWVSLNDFIRIHNIWEERDKIVLSEKQKGVKDVFIYGRFQASDSRFVMPKTGDIPLDSVVWLQNAYGQYMGVNTVKIFDSKKQKD